MRRYPVQSSGHIQRADHKRSMSNRMMDLRITVDFFLSSIEYGVFFIFFGWKILHKTLMMMFVSCMSVVWDSSFCQLLFVPPGLLLGIRVSSEERLGHMGLYALFSRRLFSRSRHLSFMHLILWNTVSSDFNILPALVVSSSFFAEQWAAWRLRVRHSSPLRMLDTTVTHRFRIDAGSSGDLHGLTPCGLFVHFCTSRMSLCVLHRICDAYQRAYQVCNDADSFVRLVSQRVRSVNGKMCPEDSTKSQSFEW